MPSHCSLAHLVHDGNHLYICHSCSQWCGHYSCCTFHSHASRYRCTKSHGCCNCILKIKKKKKRKKENKRIGKDEELVTVFLRIIPPGKYFFQHLLLVANHSGEEVSGIQEWSYFLNVITLIWTKRTLDQDGVILSLWPKTRLKGSVEWLRHERHFCSLLPYTLLSWLQISNFVCPSELHPLIWFF